MCFRARGPMWQKRTDSLQVSFDHRCTVTHCDTFSLESETAKQARAKVVHDKELYQLMSQLVEKRPVRGQRFQEANYFLETGDWRQGGRCLPMCEVSGQVCRCDPHHWSHAFQFFRSQDKNSDYSCHNGCCLGLSLLMRWASFLPYHTMGRRAQVLPGALLLISKQRLFFFFKWCCVHLLSKQRPTDL